MVLDEIEKSSEMIQFDIPMEHARTEKNGEVPQISKYRSEEKSQNKETEHSDHRAPESNGKPGHEIT